MVVPLEDRMTAGPEIAGRPSAWLIDNADLLPRGGRALDVACGSGRHALRLARTGLEVHAIDRNAEAIDRLRESAADEQLRIIAEVVDLETDPVPDLGSNAYDLVVVFNYLHRPLLPALKGCLKPGGRLFYETFTARQAERGHPRNPAFLLGEGELARLIAPFSILRSREGEFEGRCIASIVAERSK
jgi:tellurite methyltransferase